MVNQAEQIDNIEANEANNGNTTTDITEDFTGVDTFEDVSTVPEDITTTETSTSEEQNTQPEASAPSNTPVPADNTAPPAEPGPERIQIEKRVQELENQNQQYIDQQAQQQLQQQAVQMRSRYEQQGYLPEQANQIATEWLQTEKQKQDAQKQSQNQVQFIQGQMTAAEHYANYYKLELSDLTELRQYQDPKSMEAAAKRIKSDRDKDTRIAELEAQLVPAQTYDDSQSTPAATNDYDRWLERYNQGERSSQAQAAARRAAGLS